jgi:hypothetical protein
MVRIVDGSRKRLDITSGFVVLRGEGKSEIHGKRNMGGESTHDRLGNLGRW